MEAEVTSMTLGGSSSKHVHCVTCGMSERWTARMWECDVCQDYFLCENCHQGSQDVLEVVSDPPRVHNGDHHMSPHEIGSVCDGCGSYPIWNLRWHCKVCSDFDLCEVCHQVLDDAIMPLQHLKDHPMIAIEAICSDMLFGLQPNFTKPMDPQWSYLAEVNPQRCWFLWQPKPKMLRFRVDDAINPTQGYATTDDSIPNSNLEEQSTLIFGDLCYEHATPTVGTHGMLDKKHKVFFSHAGTEKDFVAQLYEDLTKVHHFGIFFDKDDDSLPKGESFPKRIFDAAKHCELAIVVISHKYFISKWPMLELATFVEAQKTRPELKIVPVFYKLTVEEFKEQRQLFEEHWNEKAMVSKNEMNGWKEALKVISQTNGVKYNKEMGEVSLREKIVKVVYNLVKPQLIWDDSHVQGKQRMQEMIKEIIQLPRNVARENQMVSTLCMGLFGVGGSGKTTTCKVWHNEMMPHFLGKVHHMEFGSEDVLQMRTKLLQSICQLGSSFLQTVDEGQALTLLKTHIPKQRVCLLIDNVSDNPSYIEETKTLLNLPFKEGSLIVVTSRSSSILETLKIERKLIMRIPSLSTEEAKALFSHHVGCEISSLTIEQMKTMEGFVEQCCFEVQGFDSKEYHPLALKVLGSQAGPNAEEWQKIKIDFKCCENENIHPIFSILRSSFDTLNLKYKRIFLDLALAYNGTFYLRMGGLKSQLRCLYDETDEKFSFKVVKDLQAKSLIDFYDAEYELIHVHDLYREFAKMEVEKKGLQHCVRCCFSRGRKSDHLVQEGRVRIYDHPISHITQDILSCAICSKAELFSIQDCANLVSVDVLGMVNLKTFHVYGGCPQLTRVNLEGAVNLRCFDWYEFKGDFFPNLSSMESLEELKLVKEEEQSLVTPHGFLDFSKNSNLEILLLSYVPLYLHNLDQAVLLKALILGNCQHMERFEGLEALVHLEDLQLSACPFLEEFPSLAYFPSLKSLSLTKAAKLKRIQGFTNLSALHKLILRGGMELEELLGIEACTRLEYLDLGGTSIRDCSWISTMKDLTWINLSGTKIRIVPDCCNLCKLSELWVEDCQALESIGDHTGLIPPTFPQSLKKFIARNCWSLNVLPKFHHESAMHNLDLYNSSVEDVSCVVCCKELQYLICAETQITSLPDLGSLTRLKELAVHGCKHLTRMDNTKSLPALEKLFVSDCTNLVALPDLRRSMRLTMLDLTGCPLVDPNAVELPSILALGVWRILGPALVTSSTCNSDSDCEM